MIWRAIKFPLSCCLIDCSEICLGPSGPKLSSPRAPKTPNQLSWPIQALPTPLFDSEAPSKAFI
jgi:hypothetical protein